MTPSIPALDMSWLHRAAHDAYFAGKHGFRGVKCGLLPLFVLVVFCGALLAFSLLAGAANSGTDSIALPFVFFAAMIGIFCCVWIEISLSRPKSHLTSTASRNLVAAPCSVTGVFVPLDRPPRAV